MGWPVKGRPWIDVHSSRRCRVARRDSSLLAAGAGEAVVVRGDAGKVVPAPSYLVPAASCAVPAPTCVIQALTCVIPGLTRDLSPEPDHAA